MDRRWTAVYPDNMKAPGASPQYRSSIPYDTERIGAAAVYCSDGRFGEQIDDLVFNALKLPRYDRLAVPGGAACLAGHFNAYREEEGVAEQLRFLLDVHAVKRVILIAHEGCAYYTEWLRVAPLQLEARQHEDLEKAIRRVSRFGVGIEVTAFFARRRGGTCCSRGLTCESDSSVAFSGQKGIFNLESSQSVRSHQILRRLDHSGGRLDHRLQ